MNFSDNCYTAEGSLISSSKRELADGVEKDPMYKLRLLCFTKGPKGIVDVARAFRHNTQDDPQAINFAAFKESISRTGLDCQENELKQMFDQFDADHKGSIDTNEFLAKLRPPVADIRSKVIERAFEKIDNTANGYVTVKQLTSVYNAKNHPKYLCGDLSEEDIQNQFLRNFNSNCAKPNKKITKEEFINYYSTVSASIDNDGYFDLLMRRAYNL